MQIQTADEQKKRVAENGVFIAPSVCIFCLIIDHGITERISSFGKRVWLWRVIGNEITAFLTSSIERNWHQWKSIFKSETKEYGKFEPVCVCALARFLYRCESEYQAFAWTCFE